MPEGFLFPKVAETMMLLFKDCWAFVPGLGRATSHEAKTLLCEWPGHRPTEVMCKRDSPRTVPLSPVFSGPWALSA